MSKANKEPNQVTVEVRVIDTLTELVKDLRDPNVTVADIESKYGVNDIYKLDLLIRAKISGDEK